MANDFRYGMNTQIVPLISPVDAAGTSQATPFVKLNNANHITFEVFFGTITGDSVVVTVEAATAAASGSEIAVPFNYRLSGAVGSDTWGAVTTADSGGVDVAATDDDKILLVDYEPATNADYNYVRLVTTHSTDVTAAEIAVTAKLYPRYGQLNPLSST